METDTILFYIRRQLRVENYVNTFIIDAEDTDVIALSSLVSNQLSGEMGIYRKKGVSNFKNFVILKLQK